jgi:hypothetical protein
MGFFSPLPGRGKLPAIDTGVCKLTCWDLLGASARVAPKVTSIATPRYQRLKAVIVVIIEPFDARLNTRWVNGYGHLGPAIHAAPAAALTW